MYGAVVGVSFGLTTAYGFLIIAWQKPISVHGSHGQHGTLREKRKKRIRAIREIRVPQSLNPRL